MSDQAKVPTNFAVKIVGNLGHDAHIFDRTCSKCKGMYNALSTPACPKCGAPLVYMTTGEGKPMSITECTFYPIFGKATSERWAKDTAARKGGMGLTWRFKMFTYADKNGVLGDHPISMMLKKGATVELRVFNHPPFATEYDSTKNPGQKMAEIMFVVYPNYGDSIKVLKQPTNIVTKVATQAATSAAPMATPELVAAITAQVLATLSGKAAPVPVPAPKAATTTPQARTAVAATAEEDIDEQVISSLYGDMDAGSLEDLPDNTASLAKIDPWN
jgi:hypothetical protein